MKVPVYDSLVSQQGLSAQQNISVNENTFADPVANIALQAAEHVSQKASSLLLSQYAKEREEANKYRAQDHLIKLEEYAQDQKFSQDGWLNQRGGDVFTQVDNKPLTDKYIDNFRQKQSELSSGLGNDEQRELFNSSANQMGLQLRSQLLNHEAEQYRTYKDGVLKSGIERKAKDIQLDYNDLDGISKKAEEIRLYGGELGKLHGISQELGIIHVDRMVSDSIKGAALSALQHGNHDAAQALIDKFGDTIDSNDKLTVQQNIIDSRASSLLDSSPDALIEQLSTASTITKNPEASGKLAQYDDIIQREASANGVDPEFIKAQIMAESGGDTSAKSRIAHSTGERSIGLSQFQPATAKRYGIDPTDPEQSIRGQAMYMSDLLKIFGGDYAKAAAGYNWGEGNVKKSITKYGDAWREHLPDETRRYVEKLTTQKDPGSLSGMMSSDDRMKWMHRAKSEQSRRQNIFAAQLKTVYQNQYAQVMATGINTSPLSKNQFLMAYGEDADKEYSGYLDNIEFAKQYKSISNMPVSEAIAMIQAMQPTADDSDSFDREQKQYNTIVNAFETVNSERIKDPIQWARQNQYPVKEINWSNPVQAAQELGSRMGVSQQMTSTYKTKPTLLTIDEASKLADTFDSMSTKSALELMNKLKSSSDSKSYQLAMQQLRKDSPVTAMAGELYGIQNTYIDPGYFSDDTVTVDGKRAAELMLKGERIQNPAKGDKAEDGLPQKSLLMPEDADLKTEFNSYAAAAFSGHPQALFRAYQAARAIYIGMLSENPGELPDLKTAIDYATGGVIDVFNAKVIPPYGMPEDVFKDKVKAQFSKQLGSLNIDDYKIIPIGENTYQFVDGMTALPVLIDLNR